MVGLLFRVVLLLFHFFCVPPHVVHILILIFDKLFSSRDRPAAILCILKGPSFEAEIDSAVSSHLQQATSREAADSVARGNDVGERLQPLAIVASIAP